MDGHGNEVAAAPRDEWALPTDSEEIAELESLGIHFADETAKLAGAPDEQDVTRLATAASFYLRRIAAADAEMNRVFARKGFELARLERVYGPQIAAELQRIETYTKKLHLITDAVEALGGFAKKKSIATGGGTFGIRACPAKAKIVDNAAVTAWALETFPDAVRVTVQMRWSDYQQMRKTLEESGIDLETDGDLLLKEKAREVLVSALQEEGVDLIKSAIPGIEVSEARTEYVIKPLPEGA